MVGEATTEYNVVTSKMLECRNDTGDVKFDDVTVYEICILCTDY